MTTVVFVRHGLTASTGERLTGQLPDVHLDERGQAQAAALAKRFAGVNLAAVVTSPLERCRETAEPIADQAGLDLHVDDRLIECGYGEWTGRTLRDIAKDPLWKVVQSHPSAAVFPGVDGESLRAVQHRAVDAVRAWNASLGPQAVWVCCSHADVIRLVLADALGMHLDEFQRLVVDPCSVSIVRYTTLRPFVLRINDSDVDLAQLLSPPKPRRKRSPRSAAASPSDRSQPHTP